MSIKHFHALSKKRREIFLNEYQRFTCKEKIDGSNLIFGLENGRLWTARKTPTVKYWAAKEWPTDMWAENFRFAHEALFGMTEEIERQAGNNFIAYAEILSNIYPNTIIYDQYQTNIVVYDGPAFFPISQRVMSTRETSHDGLNIVKARYGCNVNLRSLETQDGYWERIVKRMKEEVPYDDQPAFFVSEMNWLTSQFGNVKPEGWVFTHPDGWSFKVVDIEDFTAKNTVNYAFRKKLFRTPGQKTDSIMDQYTRERDVLGRDQAISNAVARLDVLREQYFNELMLREPDHVHQRNVDAMASLYRQLKQAEVTWVDEHSQM